MPDITLYKSHTALLIADFYAREMGSLPHAVERKCLEKTQALQQAARRAGMLICYSATVFRSGYVEVSDRNKQQRERRRSGPPAVSDPLARIHPGVKPLPSEPVVAKRRVNAFFGTDLRLILGANNIETLILLGYATGGVVLSTTRYASDADYRLFVVEDCCADEDASTHDFLCSKVLSRQSEIVQSADVIRALGV